MKIIRIGAVWCHGCLVMKKIWNNVLQEYPSLEVLEFDYDMDKEEILKYDPGKVLPLVIFLDENDKELERFVGEVSENALREKINNYVK